MKAYKLYIEEFNKTLYYESLEKALDAYNKEKMSLLERHKKHVIETHEHEDYPFEKVDDTKEYSITMDSETYHGDDYNNITLKIIEIL